MQLDPALHGALASYTQWRRESLEQDLAQELRTLTALLERCESPLEQKLFMYCIEECPLGIDVITWPQPALSICFPYALNPAGAPSYANCGEGRLRVLPQYELVLADTRYRADFLFDLSICQPSLAVSPLLHPVPAARLIVEVDGHAYHERTQEQAQRDKERDRRMVQAGYPVFRYTGAEVHHDVKRVYAEITNYLEQQAGRVSVALAKREQAAGGAASQPGPGRARSAAGASAPG